MGVPKNPSNDAEPFTAVFLLKRGTLLGAALGMLAGLIALSLIDRNPSSNAASIIIWRNWILMGAGLGFFLSGAIAWWLHSSNRDETPADSQRDPARETLP